MALFVEASVQVVGDGQSEYPDTEDSSESRIQIVSSLSYGKLGCG